MRAERGNSERGVVRRRVHAARQSVQQQLAPTDIRPERHACDGGERSRSLVALGLIEHVAQRSERVESAERAGIAIDVPVMLDVVLHDIGQHARSAVSTCDDGDPVIVGRDSRRNARKGERGGEDVGIEDAQRSRELIAQHRQWQGEVLPIGDSQEFFRRI